MTYGFRPAIVLSVCQEFGKGSIAFVSMISGAYVSNGTMVLLPKWRSPTIIRRTDMDRIPLVTPGEILNEEFLKPLEISSYRLAKDTGMPATRISQILKGKRRITADTALRLSRYFGNSPDFWLGIQDEYDLRQEACRLEEELEKIPRAPALHSV